MVAAPFTTHFRYANDQKYEGAGQKENCVKNPTPAISDQQMPATDRTTSFINEQNKFQLSEDLLTEAENLP